MTSVKRSIRALDHGVVLETDDHVHVDHNIVIVLDINGRVRHVLAAAEGSLVVGDSSTADEAVGTSDAVRTAQRAYRDRRRGGPPRAYRKRATPAQVAERRRELYEAKKKREGHVTHPYRRKTKETP